MFAMSTKISKSQVMDSCQYSQTSKTNIKIVFPYCLYYIQCCFNLSFLLLHCLPLGILMRILPATEYRDCCKKCGLTKNYCINKNHQSLPNQANIQIILPAHEMVIFTNFHSNWIKIVDF